jgi:hypothetical protein
MLVLSIPDMHASWHDSTPLELLMRMNVSSPSEIESAMGDLCFSEFVDGSAQGPTKPMVADIAPTNGGCSSQPSPPSSGAFSLQGCIIDLCLIQYSSYLRS